MEQIFSSPRLIFRKFTIHDAQLIYDLNSDPEVIKYLHELPTTIEVAKDIIQHNILVQYQKHNYGRWALHLKETEEFIGWCGLKYRADLDIIDLGYRLKKKFWSKGYATEAALKTIDYGFNTFNLTKINAFAHVENLASCRVLEKCGMKFIGFTEVDNCPVKSFEIVNTII